ncbi:MAG: TetR family transcriptional regulator [Candidatus Tectimicrobiota bacterium]|nr:MAG: TetR family transcriptional regulator [Candidatus Tectomicrobia bacterium]
MSPSKEQEIVAVAARLFKEKGYRATTLEDIAAAVGMLKGSLYYYIRSKEELLYLVVRDPIRQAYTRLEEIVASQAPVATKIAQAITNHMTLFHRHYPHIAVYLHDFPHLMHKLQQSVRETPKQYQRLWTTLLAQGVASGELRRDLDVKIAAYAILGMCNWVYRWYDPRGKLSAEEIAALFTRMILEGVLRPRPASPPAASEAVP